MKFLNTLQIVVPNGTSGVSITDGTNINGIYQSNGSPEGVVTAPVGSFALDYTSGGAYVKASGTSNTGWSLLASGTGTTNLSTGTVNASTYGINSDTGTDVVIAAATGVAAGVMPAADKVKTNFITVTSAADLDEMQVKEDALVSLSGVAANAVDLGTFTGTTIADNVTVKAAVQSLETAVEGKASSTLSSGSIYVGSAGNVATAVTLSGDVTITNAGVATVTSGTTATAGKLQLATNGQVLTGSSTSLVTTPAGVDGYFTSLIGNATGTQNLGTFTGSTIADNVSVKAALQALETAVEGISAGGMQFAGTWDATTADPSASLTNGQFYRVSVAGTTSVTTVNQGAVTSWAVGDFLMKDNLGNVHKMDNTDPLLSLGTITNTTIVIASGGTSVTVPSAVASTTQTATDGSAGLVSGGDKFKLANTGGFAANYGDGVLTTFTITHNLGTLDVIIQVYEVSTGAQVYPDIARPSTTTATITHGIAPTNNQYRVVVSRTSIA